MTDSGCCQVAQRFAYSLANCSRSGLKVTFVGLIPAPFLFSYLSGGKVLKPIDCSFHINSAIAFLAFNTSIANLSSLGDALYFLPHPFPSHKSIPVANSNDVSIDAGSDSTSWLRLEPSFCNHASLSHSHRLVSNDFINAGHFSDNALMNGYAINAICVFAVSLDAGEPEDKFIDFCRLSIIDNHLVNLAWYSSSSSSSFLDICHIDCICLRATAFSAVNMLLGWPLESTAISNVFNKPY